MTQQEIKAKAQELVDLTLQQKQIQRRIDELKEELKDQINHGVIQCTNGNVRLVTGNMVPGSTAEHYRWIFSMHTQYTDEEIDGFIQDAKGATVRYRDDYVRVRTN